MCTQVKNSHKDNSESTSEVNNIEGAKNNEHTNYHW